MTKDATTHTAHESAAGRPVTGLGVRPLQAPDIAQTAALLAEAMEVDAAYRYLFPMGDARREGLTDLFRRNLALHCDHRCTFVAVQGAGDPVATATLRPPGGLGITRWTMIRYGLLPFALRQGVTAVKRLLWLKDTYDALEADLGASGPHYYLHMMGVTPALQGTGLGGALLDRVLALHRLDSDPRPVVLTTHLRRNLAFYRKAGFTLLWERTLSPPDGDPYPVWGMARTASGAGRSHGGLVRRLGR